MVAPRGLARFNRHVTNRVLGPIAPIAPGFGMLVHTGRKSGRTFRTPVNIFRTEDGYVVALTYGPRCDWVRNVLAAGGCDAVIRGRTVHLGEPELVHDPRRSRIPAFTRPIMAAFGVDDFLLLRS
ncbi:MAG TPA: nitroreductase family deazaflavin-dependent oxidoreductase [Pseudonocardiaceae bacterium]|jgi:deazaflavin-dependent oxidoreductase (nitroreductase family)|nr:nitroreductase family deazaflavin-dependent oxidoreductase [Pseudonocardiaceae bacterium]